jgi:hypothetical protein
MNTEYTRDELEAAMRVGTCENTSTDTALLDAYHPNWSYQRALMGEVEMEGLHHVWQQRGWRDAAKMLRGEDLP